jgi:hypothetical protein
VKAQKSEFTPGKSRFLRRKRIVKAVRDVERGAKDTERRGVPNDIPGDINGETNGRRRRV